eukprot:gene24678-29820_t
MDFLKTGLKKKADLALVTSAKLTNVVLHKWYHNVDTTFNDHINIEYYMTCEHKSGRLYVRNNLGYLPMRLEIRHFLCRELYTDIDVVNCHPSMLDQVFKNQFPELRGYVLNREDYFDQLQEHYRPYLGDLAEWRVHGETKEHFKTLLIRILYGGNLISWVMTLMDYGKVQYSEVETYCRDVVGWPEFCTRLKEEVTEMTRQVKEKNPWLAAKEAASYAKYSKDGSSYRNEAGSILSFVLAEHERRVLEAMVEFLKKKGFIPKGNYVELCFDGAMVRKDESRPITKATLYDLSQHVQLKTGFSLEFKVKEMDDFQIDQVVKPLRADIEDVVVEAEEERETPVVESDKQAIDLVYDQLKDVIKHSKKKTFFKAPGTNRWVVDDTACRAHVNHYVEQTGIRKYNNNGNAVVFAENRNNATRIAQGVIERAMINSDDKFYFKLHTTNHGKLCFADGVLNVDKKEFIPWDSEEMRADPVETCIIIERNFRDVFENQDSEYWRAAKEELKAKVLNPIFDDKLPEFMHAMSRGAAGHIEDKTWVEMIGPRNCGKGVMDALFTAALEEYVTSVNSSNYINAKVNGEADKLNAWKLELEFVRIAISSELPPNAAELDGECLKSLNSGGDFQNARGNHVNQRRFLTQVMTMIMANRKAPVNPPETYETCYMFQSAKEFLTEDMLTEQNEAYDDIVNNAEKQLVTAQKTQNAKSIQEAEEALQRAREGRERYFSTRSKQDNDIKKTCRTRADFRDAFVLLLLDYFVDAPAPRNCLNPSHADEKRSCPDDDADAVLNRQVPHGVTFRALLLTWGAEDHRTKKIRNGLKGIKFHVADAKKMGFAELQDSKLTHSERCRRMNELARTSLGECSDIEDEGTERECDTPGDGTPHQQAKKRRPCISAGKPKSVSTMRTYESTLVNFFLKNRDEDESFARFARRPADELIAMVHASDRPLQSRRLILSALMSVVPDRSEDDLRMAIRELKGRIEEQYADAKDTPRSSLTMKDIMVKYNAALARVERDPTHKNWVDAILIALTSGIHVFPRRSADWVWMNWRDGSGQLNEYDGRRFIFRVYKTAKSHSDPQIVPVPLQLRALLDDYKEFLKTKMNESPYIISPNGTCRFSASGLTKRLNSIYGDGVSVSVLRSIYASDTMGDDMRELNALKRKIDEKAEQMGTSSAMLDQVYIKEKKTKREGK